MKLQTHLLNPNVQNCASAPIAEVWSWINDPDSPNLIDMCQAVPAHLPAPALRDYLADAIRQGQGAHYTDIEGTPELRAGLAKDIKQRYQGDVLAEDVVITAGCNQAFCSVLDTLCAAGDEVIVPLPCYFNHQMWLDIRAVTPRYLSLNPDTALPDPQAVNALVTERTRAIILVTPNNPTGAVYRADMIDQFYQLAREHNIALIIDETYRDFMDDSRAPHHLFERDDWRDVFIHLYSFSKVFALTGHRVGAVVAGPQLLEQMVKVQDCAIICAPHTGQLAAAYGLQHLSDWKQAKFLLMQQRALALQKAFAHPDLNYRVLSVGAYFAYIEHPFAASARTVAKRLVQEFEVLCLPGSYFGEQQEQYLRFAFANVDEKRFPELVERLLASQ